MLTRKLSLFCVHSVTSVKTRDELYGGGPAAAATRRSSQQSGGSGSGSGSGPGSGSGSACGESPRSSKLVSQQSVVGGGSSRVSRQRSFKNASEDVIKRSRAQQAASYQLSQDLHDKQVSRWSPWVGE